MAVAIVEVKNGLAWRIFSNTKAAAIYACNPSLGLYTPQIVRMPRAQAVGEIRQQVYDRDLHRCVHCGLELVFKRGYANSMEMDERQARGTCVKQASGHYESGPISVENGQSLCKPCHTGPNGKHQRQPQWSNGPGL